MARRTARGTLPASSPTAIRVRARCLQRGWDLGELARHSGVALSTLHELLSGRTARPHLKTLSRLADALEVSVAELWDDRPCRSVEPAATSDHAAAQVDRLTNPCVTEAAGEFPQLFRHWSPADWDSLYSSFGTGGPLTRHGVLQAARRINRRRETVRQLQIVLETHLEAVAAELVGTLYRLVRPASNLANDRELEALLSTCDPPPGED